MTAKLDPRVQELLDTFLLVAHKVDKPYAIGGALAMAAHGYERQTKDVDAFIDHEDRSVWLRALRESGLKVEPLMAGIHYIAYLPQHEDPEVRIDVLIPADNPDVSAVAVPDRMMLGDCEMDVFPVDLLVIAKYQSTREKDRADVLEMFERGMFDPRSVRKIIKHMGDEEMASEFWQEYGK